MTSFNQHLSDEDVLALVRRMSLSKARRHLEEQIIAVVPIEKTWLDENSSRLMNDLRRMSLLKRKAGAMLT